MPDIIRFFCLFLYLPLAELAGFSRRFKGRNECEVTARGLLIKRFLLGDLFLLAVIINAMAMALIVTGVLMAGAQQFLDDTNPRAAAIWYCSLILPVLCVPLLVYFAMYPPWHRHLVLAPDSIIIMSGEKELYRIPWKDIEELHVDGIWSAIVLRGKNIVDVYSGIKCMFRQRKVYVLLKGCSVEPNQLELIIRTMYRYPEIRPHIRTEQGRLWVQSGPQWGEIRHHPVKKLEEEPVW